MHAEKEITVCMGQVPEKADKAIADVQYATEGMLPLLKPGTVVKDWYLLERGSYEDAPPARIGHCIGLGPHEDTSIAANNELVVQEGMTWTIEPNVYIPGGLMTQISNMIVITKDRFKYLTAPVDLVNLRV